MSSGIPARLLSSAGAGVAVTEGDWILRQGAAVPELLLLLAGEAELWRDERLLGIVLAPRLLGVAAHATASVNRTGVRAGPGARVAAVGELTKEELVCALAAELTEAEAQWVSSVVACDDFFQSPNAQLIPGPFQFGPFSGVLMVVETEREALQRLLPPGLELLPGSGGRYLLAVSDIQGARAPQAGPRSFAYRETTPLLPCQAGKLSWGVYIPELYPDAYMPILLGRELYGFPKRLGRTRLDASGADVIVDQARLLRARWSQPEPLSGADFVAELVRELLPGFGFASLASGLARRVVRWLDAAPAVLGRGGRASVFVRRQLRSPESLATEHFQLDELVEVPFHVAPSRKIEELRQHSVSFGAGQQILSGHVRRVFRAEVAFHFGLAKRRRLQR